MYVNLLFAWLWILVGLVSGTVIGVSFHREDWLGGYNSWRRRLVRLAHISFLGTGLLNLAFFLSVQYLGVGTLRVAAWLFVAGGVTMPTVCLLAAWRDPLRHLFFVPVACLLGGVLDLIVRGLL